MKTNKLPRSAWSDSKAAGSQSKSMDQSYKHQLNQDKAVRAGNIDHASNDASYIKVNQNQSNYSQTSSNDEYQENIFQDTPEQSSFFGYKSMKNPIIAENNAVKPNQVDIDSVDVDSVEEFGQSTVESDSNISTKHTATSAEIPERIFMNGLIKHTGIALAIIIPLAAFSAFAATPPIAPPSAGATTSNKPIVETMSVQPSDIIYKSATVPTTVDSVDLKKYAGTWYEIGRLPMYFQRNCVSDVTATYVEKTDGSGIKVINKCSAEDGSGITAEGLAKPADATGSKLKVTFLPSWIRWLPVGRADYWVLARDADYKTALVGTPDKKYLWLLARSPNVSQETYAKYRQIAQQQGYDLKEFTLTSQSNQTVNLIP